MKRLTILLSALLMLLVVFSFGYSVYAQQTTAEYCKVSYVAGLGAGGINAGQLQADALEKSGEKIDAIERGEGPYYSDEFSVTVKMPADVTPEEFLFRMVVNRNAFLNDKDFDRYMIQNPLREQGVPPQVGDIYDVDLGFVWEPLLGVLGTLPNPADAQVMLTELYPSHFKFTTITDKNEFYIHHPTPGERTWGFEKLDNGDVQFYNRGYSRVGRHVVDLLYGLQLSLGPQPGDVGYPPDPDLVRKDAIRQAAELVHESQKEAWTFEMEAIAKKVIELGGSLVGDVESEFFVSNKPSQCGYNQYDEIVATWDYSGLDDPLEWGPSDN